jgi:hypothetical protein
MFGVPSRPLTDIGASSDLIYELARALPEAVVEPVGPGASRQEAHLESREALRISFPLFYRQLRKSPM